MALIGKEQLKSTLMEEILFLDELILLRKLLLLNEQCIHLSTCVARRRLVLNEMRLLEDVSVQLIAYLMNKQLQLFAFLLKEEDGVPRR